MSNIILILHNSYYKKTRLPPPKKIYLASILHSQSMVPCLTASPRTRGNCFCVSLPCQALHSKTGPVNFNHCQMPGTESLPLLLMPGALSLSPFGALMTACHLLFPGCSIYVCLLSQWDRKAPRPGNSKSHTFSIFREFRQGLGIQLVLITIYRVALCSDHRR